MRNITLFCALVFFGCTKNRVDKTETVLFTDITDGSGIVFRNDLKSTEQLNPYTYRNFYNGAGVAVGDINNDGLLDIYFAGNQVDNRLFLNQGNMNFKDITQSAGVACHGVWSTGVTFVDINADGLLDIYVCKSGNPDALQRHNELFINNGDLTFSEKSKEYGLDYTGLSVQAVFFDYDKDGDLDCYLLTNSFRSVGNYDLVEDQRNSPDPQGGGNKFLVNENGKFKDYSELAGIYRSTIGFGLGVTLGDFNNDSWTDIFVSNDFFERDYLYINNRDGSFTEALTSYFQSISMGSMGADLADLDNDGVPELFVTEMLPDSLTRRKTKTVFESWDKYQLSVSKGYHHQFSRNVLQKKVGVLNYAEVGRFAGVAASEWSWGALLFDMDNDGYRDIFVANGIYKDLLDRDYLSYEGTDDKIRKMIKEEKDVIIELISLMPGSQFPNYAFRNEGDLIFSNVATQWGLGKPMFSSGSAYGDFDNDGDLDLVVNNINAPSAIYRNNTDTSKFKSISIALSSDGNNTHALGAEVWAFAKDQIFYADNFVTRGFQSSVQPKIHIGLGENIQFIDSIVIRWPDNGRSTLFNVRVNQELKINNKEVENKAPTSVTDFTHNKNVDLKLELVSNELFRHRSSGLIDFNRDRLLPMMYSNETPFMLKGDINNDGVDEFYIGGGKNQQGIFIEHKGDKFIASSRHSMGKFNLSEETKGTFFDADGDGDLDFYMASGGRFFSKASSALADRLWINNGNGEFTESPFPLPFVNMISTSIVQSLDFDNDGDLDLFVGERFDPFVYGRGGRGFLFQNDGEGKFEDVTSRFASMLTSVGMVTDCQVVDINNDGWDDIILVGDWMPVVVLLNEKGTFTDASHLLSLDDTEGWWHTIEVADLNLDGRPDLVMGNHGKNSFFTSGDRMYVGDFDENGAVEQIFCTRVGNSYYPLADRDELISQLPFLKKQLLYYKDYAKKSIEDIFPKTVLEKAEIFEVKTLSSMVFLSGPDGYRRSELPMEAQFAPIYSLRILDYDNDGVLDLIAGGNQFGVKPQFGRYDGSQAWFFKGNLNGSDFSFSPGIDLNVNGQIRDIEVIKVNEEIFVLFTKNDDELEIYKIIF